ncbi:MAG: stage II sporulation protein M [Planctomycetota bacterium]|jgi:uncharacterized membrane protein SpoIIM required for sporulation
MKPVVFRKERQRHWIQLRSLVDRIEKKGIRSLSVGEARRLGGLYRSTVSSYTVLKGLTLDRRLVLFLRDLVTRAYLAIYHYETVPDVRPLRFFLKTWPGLVRKNALLLLFIGGVFLIASGVAWSLAAANPHVADILIPASLAGGRQSDSTAEELQSVLVSGRAMGSPEKTYFGTFLFTHNAKVGILSFAFGIAAGIPAVALTAYQGLVLGAMGGLYDSRNLSSPFLAWVLPHGVTEILAILLCATAGLLVGLSVVRPGNLRWQDAVGRAGREAGWIVLGTLPLFFFAAVIESFLRQSHLSDDARFLFAALTLIAWIAYFSLAGKRDPEETKIGERSRIPSL